MRLLPNIFNTVNESQANFGERERRVPVNVSFGQSTDNTDIGQNISGVWVTGTSPATVDTEFAVTVNLGRLPVGFDVKRQNKAASFYDSGTTWTATTVYLKCNVASVAYTLFVH